MEKVDVIPMILIFVFGLCFGMLIAQSYGYQKGYEKGFDKALPLTYASMYKK